MEAQNALVEEFKEMVSEQEKKTTLGLLMGMQAKVQVEKQGDIKKNLEGNRQLKSNFIAPTKIINMNLFEGKSKKIEPVT